MNRIENGTIDAYALDSKKPEQLKKHQQLDAENAPVIKNLDTQTNLKTKEVDLFFNELTTINKWDKALRKTNINTLIATKQMDIDAFVASPAYEQLLKEARNGWYNSADKAKSMKMNFALQVYARQELWDKTIAIDGQAWPQTLTVLRYIQVEGIGGDPMSNIQLTSEQQQKIAEYREYRSWRLLKRASLVAESVLNPIVPISENNNVPKTESDSKILSNNKSIEWSINNLPPAPTEWIQTQWPILDPFEIGDIVNKNIPDTTIAKPYTDYLVNNRQWPLPAWVSPSIDTSINNIINKKSIEKKQSVSSLCQRQSYLSCIKWFEWLLRNFTSDPIQQEQWMKSLETQAQSHFDTVKLSLKINIGWEDIRFIYDTEKGEILANALIYKDPITKNITTSKESKFSPIITNIPWRSNIEKNMQTAVNTKINSNLLQMADFQESVQTESKNFNISMINKPNLDKINKVVESNYINKYVLDWTKEHWNENVTRREFTQQENSDLYKVFDIVARTIDTYKTSDLTQLRGKLAGIHDVYTAYHTKEINDERAPHLKKDKLKQDISGNIWSYGLLMIFENCTTYAPSTHNHMVMDLGKMQKIINTHKSMEQEWFGPITHQAILSHQDKITASQDADKLLENAYT